MNPALTGSHKQGNREENGDNKACWNQRHDCSQGRNDCVDDYAREDHSARAEFLGQPAVKDGEGKGENLDTQKRAENHHESHSDAVGEVRRHFNDGVNSIDVEEIGQKKEENPFMFFDFYKSFSEPFKAFQNR